MRKQVKFMLRESKADHLGAIGLELSIIRQLL